MGCTIRYGRMQVATSQLLVIQAFSRIRFQRPISGSTAWLRFKFMCVMPKKNSGWSLFELLVVIVLLGLLAVILFPAFARTGSNTHALQCLNNLRQLMAATLTYTHENHDLF